MRLPLRWKIAAAFICLTAVILTLLGLYLNALVVSSSKGLMRRSLLLETRLVQRDVPPPPWAPSPSLQHLAADLDRMAEARVTLIDADGLVAADSRDEPAKMENHANRPERLQALEQGTGSAIRYSATLRLNMLYVTVAVPETGANARPVLRLARPMAEVQAATQRVQRALLLAFVLAAALIWVFSLPLAASLTAPVRQLVRVARRIDRGDPQARAEGITDPDLGELAAVFNSALDSLAHLVAVSQREGRHYAAILEQMSDAVVITDQSGHIEFINPTFARVFGLHDGDVAGRTAEEIALNYDLSALLSRAVKQGAVQYAEVRLLYPEPRILATAVTPLYDDSRATIGAVALLRDVTDLHRLDEVRREFVANASHELRTPAAAVRALAEALQIGALKDPERGPRFVQQIVEAADRQTSILDDMLTLTRVERGRELLHIAPLQAAEAFEEAARQIRPAAAARGVELQVQVAPEDLVVADPGGLRTVLLNLLDNGVKYSQEGGTVTLRGRPVPAAYEITVTDTGIGIPPEHQGRIFERFYRADRARDRATGGTGLGLAIVKHLMEAHGGKVSVRSVEGEGATFTLLFPAAPPANGAAS